MKSYDIQLTESFQFPTRPYLENTFLEIIKETKLLGTIVTSDLTCNKNRSHCKKGISENDYTPEDFFL
jgi:hypothetical protein